MDLTRSELACSFFYFVKRLGKVEQEAMIPETNASPQASIGIGRHDGAVP
jgi:hypothetical protein